MTCFHRLLGRPDGSETDEEVSGIENIVKIYKYKELRTATNDFSPDNKIGRGGFGSVYQGKLKNGKIAAIKVLSAESKQGINEFLMEIKAIACIQHENLVKICGCCVEGNRRILIYNYLENNSLEKTFLGMWLLLCLGFLASFYGSTMQLGTRCSINRSSDSMISTEDARLVFSPSGESSMDLAKRFEIVSPTFSFTSSGPKHALTDLCCCCHSKVKKIAVFPIKNS